MKKLFSICIACLTISNVIAQDYTDVLRYTETQQQGNARFSAMGGAFGALGANVASVSVNPASSALFKGNVFEFSPAFTLSKTQNYYQNQYDRAFSNTLKMPNIGIVFAKEISANDLKIKGIAYGFTVNRLQQYNQTTAFNAVNKSSSITDDFLRMAESNPTIVSDLAVNANLIGNDNGFLYTDYRWLDNNLVVTEYGQDQSIEIREKGQRKEYLFNFGINFNDKVFLGADLAFESIYYKQESEFEEIDAANVKPFLNSFVYSTSLEVDAAATSGKIGVIIKPNDMFRIGFAAHSPSIVSVNENFSYQIDSYFDQDINGENNFSKSYDAENDYVLARPGKIVGSLGFVYKNIALFDVDYESVDYENAYFTGSDSKMTHENQSISDNLTTAQNIKLGGELKYGPLSFRAGYALYGNPVVNEDLLYKGTSLSGGIGISNDDFYCDLSVVKYENRKNHILYHDYEGKPVTALTKSFHNNVMCTVGFKF